MQTRRAQILPQKRRRLRAAPALLLLAAALLTGQALLSGAARAETQSAEPAAEERRAHVLVRIDRPRAAAPDSDRAAKDDGVRPATTRACAATPPRRGDGPLRVTVLGDSLAQNLWEGMRFVAARRGDVDLTRRVKAATGLVRTDRFDWFERARRVVRKDRSHALIIMIGGNDRQMIREDGKRYRRFTQAWYAAYRRRVERFGAILSEADAKLYWVGLPVVRSGKMTRDYETMNRIFRSAAQKACAEFIDVFGAFRDKRGRFTTTGPALDGRVKRLRHRDGMHFSLHGAQVLADKVFRRVSDDFESFADIKK